LRKTIRSLNHALKNLDEDRNEVIRQKSLINQANQEEFVKYEELLAKNYYTNQLLKIGYNY
jgi:hypothetical protein